MQVVNVIELIDGNPTVNSFTIMEDSVRRDAVVKNKIDAAEKLFIKLARDNGISERDINYCLEEGRYELGNYQLFLIWSENVNSK